MAFTAAIFGGFAYSFRKFACEVMSRPGLDINYTTKDEYTHADALLFQFKPLGITYKKVTVCNKGKKNGYSFQCRKN